MPAIAEENMYWTRRPAHADSESLQANHLAWAKLLSILQLRQRQLAPYDTEPLNPPPNHFLLVHGLLEHFWHDGSAAVSVNHEEIGWLEFDIPAAGLPAGVCSGDWFEVSLMRDIQGHVMSYGVPPRAKIIRRPGFSVGDKLEDRIPKPPKNWEDRVDVDRYYREMAEWEMRAGFEKRELKGK